MSDKQSTRPNNSFSRELRERLDADHISEKRLAEFLAISYPTIVRWRGKSPPTIPFYRVGDSIRYSVDDLADFLEAGRTGDVARRPTPNGRPRLTDRAVVKSGA